MASNKATEVNQYVHEVSNVLIGKTTGNRYFEFKLQETESQFTRVACFSPEKRHAIREKQESKQPIRLVNVSPQKRKYSPDSNEYTMGKYSKVMDGNNLCFPWKSFPQASTEPVSLADGLSNNETGDIVCVKAKVYFMSEIQNVYSPIMKKELKKRELIIVDVTGSLHLCIWEDQMDEVKNDQFYLFTNVKVSFFKKTYLNCTKKCVITALEEKVEVPSEIQE